MNAAISQLRFAIATNVVGIVAVVVACLVVGERSGASASDVAWITVPVSALTTVVLAVEVLLRHQGLVQWRRTIGGVVVGAVACLPPLAAGDDDLLRTSIAAACGVAWLVVIVRLRLVDPRRAQASPPAVADVEHA